MLKFRLLPEFYCKPNEVCDSAPSRLPFDSPNPSQASLYCCEECDGENVCPYHDLQETNQIGPTCCRSGLAEEYFFGCHNSHNYGCSCDNDCSGGTFNCRNFCGDEAACGAVSAGTCSHCSINEEDCGCWHCSSNQLCPNCGTYECIQNPPDCNSYFCKTCWNKTLSYLEADHEKGCCVEQCYVPVKTRSSNVSSCGSQKCCCEGGHLRQETHHQKSSAILKHIRFSEPTNPNNGQPKSRCPQKPILKKSLNQEKGPNSDLLQECNKYISLAKKTKSLSLQEVKHSHKTNRSSTSNNDPPYLGDLGQCHCSPRTEHIVGSSKITLSSQEEPENNELGKAKHENHHSSRKTSSSEGHECSLRQENPLKEETNSYSSDHRPKQAKQSTNSEKCSPPQGKYDIRKVQCASAERSHGLAQSHSLGEKKPPTGQELCACMESSQGSKTNCSLGENKVTVLFYPIISHPTSAEKLMKGELPITQVTYHMNRANRVSINENYHSGSKVDVPLVAQARCQMEKAISASEDISGDSQGPKNTTPAISVICDRSFCFKREESVEGFLQPSALDDCHCLETCNPKVGKAVVAEVKSQMKHGSTRDEEHVPGEGYHSSKTSCDLERNKCKVASSKFACSGDSWCLKSNQPHEGCNTKEAICGPEGMGYGLKQDEALRPQTLCHMGKIKHSSMERNHCLEEGSALKSNKPAQEQVRCYMKELQYTVEKGCGSERRNGSKGGESCSPQGRPQTPKKAERSKYSLPYCPAVFNSPFDAPDFVKDENSQCAKRAHSSEISCSEENKPSTSVPTSEESARRTSLRHKASSERKKGLGKDECTMLLYPKILDQPQPRSAPEKCHGRRDNRALPARSHSSDRKKCIMPMPTIYESPSTSSGEKFKCSSFFKAKRQEKSNAATATTTSLFSLFAKRHSTKNDTPSCVKCRGTSTPLIDKPRMSLPKEGEKYSGSKTCIYGDSRLSFSDFVTNKFSTSTVASSSSIGRAEGPRCDQRTPNNSQPVNQCHGSKPSAPILSKKVVCEYYLQPEISLQRLKQLTKKLKSLKRLSGDSGKSLQCSTTSDQNPPAKTRNKILF